jgi:hypothetical protein
MKPLTTYETWYGRDEPPPEVVKLRAGGLEVEFQDGDLRYLRAAGQELIRRIYSAVRDVNWNTIPARRTNLSLDSAEDRFRIEFDAVHEAGALAFRWHAAIEGQPDGTIEYVMNGVAERDFRYCRIGFCVLHPIQGIAGSPYRAITPDGPVSGVLPELIEPQRMVGDFEAPIFPSCSSLTVELPGGFKLTAEFEGDLFETEDQRNWTDGSFKTYCTPIALGYPHSAQAGQTVYQKVTIRADLPRQGGEVLKPAGAQPIPLSLGEPTGRVLPRLGFGMASHGLDLSAHEAQCLAELRPDHLKAEVRLRSAIWQADLARAISAALQIGCPLELALFLTDDPDDALGALKTRLDGVPMARVIVFHEAEAPVGTTSARWMQMARHHLADALPGTPLIGGTDGNFAELNRQLPDVSAMDGVSYTINPQVHLTDERSLIEAIEAQHDTVVTARSFCGALPISVSSVTLKPPFNQAAREDEAPPDPNELPPAVDPRQMSLFAAAWTVGSVRSLGWGGADSVTFYETTGWRGLMETAHGSPLPEKFCSFPGMIYPVYWVFDFLTGAKGAALRPLRCDQPLLLDGLAFQQGERLAVLVANLQPQSQEVHLSPVPEGEASVRRLNEDTMAVASAAPDAFRQQSDSVAVRGARAVHTLKPYETAFFEFKLL